MEKLCPVKEDEDQTSNDLPDSLMGFISNDYGRKIPE